ncbi:MAG: polyprenyl synthetase family protein [Candidatus Thorarchaeota archaeon]|nr:polyprenyl synthetase family protein [Candidatus Thorarchaeota archaeon]
MTDYLESLKGEIVIVTKTLDKFFSDKIDQVTHLGAWHKQYYTNVKEYIMRGGKRLRPVLVILGYKAVKGDTVPDNLYTAALCVEILHNGSLLHDDLIDHDETRRGGKTFHATYRDINFERTKDKDSAFNYGMTMAILGGDSLINLGASAITAAKLEPDISSHLHHLYEFAFQYLVDGVLLEMNMISDETATSETYLQMVRMKTAILFDRSLMMGAAVARATESQLNALEEFGIKIGQAFQVQDDILGSFGDEEKLGKSASGDIREGKKTLLVFEVIAKANTKQREEFDKLLGKSDITEQEIERVRELFRETGSLESTQKKMTDLLASGQKALDKAEPALDSKYKEFLVGLSDFLVQRDF